MEIKQFAAGSQVEETKWKLRLVTTICVISTTSPYIDVIAILGESVFITSTSIYHLL